MQISFEQLQSEVQQKIEKGGEGLELLKNRIDNIVNTTHDNEIIVEIYKTYPSIEDMVNDAINVEEGYIVTVNDTASYTVLIYKRDSAFLKDTENNEDGYRFLSRINDAIIIQGPQGPQGEEGKGFQILGVYDSSLIMSAEKDNYKDGDIVILKQDGKALMYTKDDSIIADGAYDKLGFKYIIDLAELAAIKGDKGDPGLDGAKGDKGDDGFTPTISADTSISGQVSLTVTGKDNSYTVIIKDGQNGKSAYDIAVDNGWDSTQGQAQWLLSLKGDKGDQGDKGDKGDRGEGFAIVKLYHSNSDMVADVANIDIGKMVAVIEDTGANVYIRDANGTDEPGYTYVTNLADATVIKGDKGDQGDKGDKGDDGVSPSITITPITGGNKVTISDHSGSKSFNIMNGEKGDKGDLPTLDSAPTNNSTNGVTSGGTFNAIKTVQDSVTKLENKVGLTMPTKTAPTLEYMAGHAGKYIRIRTSAQAHVQFIDDFGHYVFGMDGNQLMWVQCSSSRPTRNQCTFYAINGTGADAGVYFQAAAATPVVLYNSLTTAVTLVDTLPTTAKKVPWTKYSDFFWGAKREDVQ